MTEIMQNQFKITMHYEMPADVLSSLTDADIKWLEQEVSKRIERYMADQLAIALYGFNTSLPEIAKPESAKRGSLGVVNLLLPS